jgi:hypothetical protein
MRMSQRNPIIICSAIIIFSILVGLYGWGVIESHIYIAVLMFVMFFAVGTFIWYMIFGGLRRGVISINAKASISVYDRRQNPFAFWFYIFLFFIVGLLAYGAGIYILFHPSLR